VTVFTILDSEEADGPRGQDLEGQD